MELPSKGDITNYFHGRRKKITKTSKILGGGPKLELSLCRGMMVPFVFNPFVLPFNYYFIIDLMDEFEELLYPWLPQESTLDFNNYCKIGISLKETKTTAYGLVSTYSIYPAVILKPYKIPKTKFNYDSDF